MIENDHLQSNSGAIEALKAATRQVRQPAPRDEQFDLPKQKPQPMTVFENFAEAFARKITSVEQEKVAIEKEQLVVEQELSQVEKLHTDLIEKKKQLENRKNELEQVKDKLAVLDKEISEALEFSSL